MIKGVNHQIVEVTKPTCEYFERVIFFVKPEFSAVSEGTLRERAGTIAGEAGSPPATKLKTNKLIAVAKYVGASIGGVLLGILLGKLLF